MTDQPEASQHKLTAKRLVAIREALILRLLSGPRIDERDREPYQAAITWATQQLKKRGKS